MPQTVIKNMKITLETLEKRQLFLETRSEKFKLEARLYIKINKKKEEMLLKKAKMSEKQLMDIYKYKDSIEMQISVLEKGILNKIIGKYAIDDISELMVDEMRGDICDDK